MTHPMPVAPRASEGVEAALIAMEHAKEAAWVKYERVESLHKHYEKAARQAWIAYHKAAAVLNHTVRSVATVAALTPAPAVAPGSDGRG